MKLYIKKTRGEQAQYRTKPVLSARKKEVKERKTNTRKEPSVKETKRDRIKKRISTSNRRFLASLFRS